MKFPMATIILVSAALLYVLYEYTREPPPEIDASTIANLAAEPVERGRVLEWVGSRIGAVCEDATGQTEGGALYEQCIEDSESRKPICLRTMADQFPSMIRSEQIFRDLSVTMMNCLVRQSRVLGG